MSWLETEVANDPGVKGCCQVIQYTTHPDPQIWFSITAMSTGKRSDYLSWDEYFMAVAFLAAKRSKDPVTQVGACIVDKRNVVVGLGYNGMPTGCSDDAFPWKKDSPSSLDNKFFYGKL